MTDIEITPAEQEAYKMIFKNQKSLEEVSESLKKKGITISAKDLDYARNEIYDILDKEQMKDKMMNSMLDSFDRTKIEFEDSVSRLKKWITEFEGKGQTFQAMVANRELMAHINLALKTLGKIDTSITNIKAKNINIIGTTDHAETFRKMQNYWFESMDAHLENGTLIFYKPSPEMIDDYLRWESDLIKKAIPVGSNIQP